MAGREVLQRHVIERLPRYYHYIRNVAVPRGQETISSAQLAAWLRVDDTLIRHDLAKIGVKGQPRRGFRCSEVVAAIRQTLGFDREKRAIIIGAGRLGGAIASYRGFEQYGLRILAAGDSAPAREQQMLGRIRVYPLEDLEAVIRKIRAELAIITVPREAACEVAERVQKAGVRCIWNFAPAHLEVSDEIFVRNELLSVGLAELSYRLHHTRRYQRRETAAPAARSRRRAP